MDDEMTFGVLNLLEANAVDEATKKDLEDMEVYISASSDTGAFRIRTFSHLDGWLVACKTFILRYIADGGGGDCFCASGDQCNQ